MKIPGDERRLHCATSAERRPFLLQNLNLNLFLNFSRWLLFSLDFGFLPKNSIVEPAWLNFDFFFESKKKPAQLDFKVQKE